MISDAVGGYHGRLSVAPYSRGARIRECVYGGLVGGGVVGVGGWGGDCAVRESTPPSAEAPRGLAIPDAQRDTRTTPAA